MESTPSVWIIKEANKDTSCGIFLWHMFWDNSTYHRYLEKLKPNKKKHNKDKMSDKYKNRSVSIFIGSYELRYFIQCLSFISCDTFLMNYLGNTIKILKKERIYTSMLPTAPRYLPYIFLLSIWLLCGCYESVYVLSFRVQQKFHSFLFSNI